MARDTRRKLIKKLEKARGSKVICYVTSLRPGAGGQISDDAVREIIDHLQKIQTTATTKLDLLLVSNGGDGIVPWRLVPLFKEYVAEFNVLIPFRAYSAATIMALGASEIVMHRFGVLGPIDPTVTNDFNPIEDKTNRRLGISVEDVKSYISFIRDTVGINHEEELVKTVEILANRIHPLALGNVERFLLQSRMIARKLLELHTEKDHLHKTDAIIEALASKLYFHGHPINRREAEQLGLKVASQVPSEVEDAMWALYIDFEEEMQFREPFEPIGQLFASLAPNSGTPGLMEELVRRDETIVWAMVESADLSSRFANTTRYTINSDPMNNLSIGQQVLRQRWDRT